MIRLLAPSRAVIGGLAASLALGLSAPALAHNDGPLEGEVAAQAAPLTKGEQRLAKLLEGREAGQPVSCIYAPPRQRMQTIEGTAYVYGSGNTIYVQRTRAPDQIDNFDALVVNRFSGSQLCRSDVMTTIDRANGFFTGAVFFDDFVPYTRVQTDQSGKG